MSPPARAPVPPPARATRSNGACPPPLRAATDAPCSLSARHILPCPRASPALCRLTLCCPPSQVVSTSRQLCTHVPHGRLRAHRPQRRSGAVLCGNARHMVIWRTV
eukprot:2542095-Prymnesium_polylepis.2